MRMHTYVRAVIAVAITVIITGLSRYSYALGQHVAVLVQSSLPLFLPGLSSHRISTLLARALEVYFARLPSLFSGTRV